MCEHLVAEFQAAIAAAWSAAERRAAERLGGEVAAARAAAETASQAQNEADESLAATDAAMALLQTERGRLVALVETATAAAAHAMGERDALAVSLPVYNKR